MRTAFISKIKRAYETAQDVMAEKGLDRDHEQPWPRLHKFAHFCVLVIKSFLRNKCPLRATALSYTTLLALVPLLAIGASITSSVLKERGEAATRDLIKQFVNVVAPQLKLFSEKEVGGNMDGPQAVVEQINQAIGNFHSKTLGFTGLIGFILVAILLLSTIEDTFNDIWGVTHGRGWFRRLVQYWTTISLGPIFLVVAFLLTQGPEFQATQLFLTKFPMLGSAIFDVMPFVLISLTFALFYKLMPNTQVHWRAALVAGAVGGCLWLLNNLFNAANLGKVINMSKLYGPLAIIPIFLVGLYFSWLIVLFGAQVAYALQNRKVYLQDKKTEGISQRCREFIALRVMLDIGQRFEMQTTPPTILEVSDHLGVPSRLVGTILRSLIAARLVVEAAGEDASYVPARPLETISCQDVIQALRVGTEGPKELETEEEPAREIIRREFSRIEEAEKHVAAGLTIKDLAHQIAAQPVPIRAVRA